MLEITFLDVGNADSIVILPPGASAVVVDTPNPRRVYKWLKGHNRTIINCLYFTHAHQDHLPSLSSLKDFITEWLKIGSLEELCLPTDAFRVNLSITEPRKAQIVRDALDRLDLWESNRDFKIVRGEANRPPNEYGDTKIYILHPSPMYYERYFQAHPHKLNETSLVLRIEYGDFCTLLLADVEQDGLTNLLKKHKDHELYCQVIKIPHHGAWQADEATFQSLLKRANPELAVLSVGSQNKYGHVVPQLFRELLKLKQSNTARLRNFLCTQITRTCLHSAAERSKMGKQGLKTSSPCAGDIVILADSSGSWKLKNQGVHSQHVNTIPLAACRGHADLGI